MKKRIVAEAVEQTLMELVAPRWNDPLTVADMRGLLDSLPNIDAVDTSGGTALHYLVGAVSSLGQDAARYREGGTRRSAKTADILQTILDCCLEVLGIALERGANLNHRDNEGFAPIHQLCRGAPLPSVAKLLVEHGADVNAKDIEGETPLLSFGLCDPEIFAVLADAGANLDAQDEAGCTALMRAVQSESLWAIEALIARGCDVSLAGWGGAVKGKRAIDLLRKGKNPKLRALLEQAASTPSSARSGAPKRPQATKKAGGITGAELERRLQPHIGKAFLLSELAASRHWNLSKRPRVLLFSWPAAADELKQRFAKSMRKILGKTNSNLVPIGFTGDEKLSPKSSLEEVNVRLPHGLLYCDLEVSSDEVTAIEYWPFPMRSWGDIGRIASSFEELFG